MYGIAEASPIHTYSLQTCAKHNIEALFTSFVSSHLFKEVLLLCVKVLKNLLWSESTPKGTITDYCCHSQML